MGIRLGQNNYGKSRVRLLRLVHGPHGNQINEFTVAVRFEGDFETVHTLGDNSKVLPTDTMKNTVYALAQEGPLGSAEAFAQRLIEHFLKNCPEVSRVEVDVHEDLWQRATSNSEQHSTAFVRAGEQKRIAYVSGTREKTTLRAGVQDLIVMKTAQSAFLGFRKDQYTTLKEDRNRIMATSVKAEWLYGTIPSDFNQIWQDVCETLVDAFAAHESLSLQHTLYAMGETVLKKFQGIREIHLSLPNKHYNLVNLSQFGLDNPSEVFLPTSEPHGLIEGTVTRD